MLVNSNLRHQPTGCPAPVLCALTPLRLSAALVTALFLSLSTLATLATLGFLSPTELALAWAEHLAELTGGAAVACSARGGGAS